MSLETLADLVGLIGLVVLLIMRANLKSNGYQSPYRPYRKDK